VGVGGSFNQPRTDVPDSCCMIMAPNCGRQLNLIGSRDQQGAVVYIEGCYQAYSDFFSGDIIFMCTLSLVLSIGLLFISAILVFSYTLIRKNYEILIRSTR